jgi:hypothetical protein
VGGVVSKCGKCGVEGHNARSCKGDGAAAPAKAPKVKKAAKAKSVSSMTVTESLIQRRDALQSELTTITRILGDLKDVGIE